MSFFVPQSPPRRPREPIFLAPPAPLYLAGVFAVIHALVYFVLPTGLAGEIFVRSALIPLKFTLDDAAVRAEAFANLVTHGFLHDGLMHLFVNALWLLAAGGGVSRQAGGRVMFTIFILCTIAGGICFTMLRWDSDAMAIGASGGISGLLAVAVRFHFGQFFAGGVAPLHIRPVLAVSVMYVGINAAIAVWDMLFPESASGFAWEAHIGGYLAGLFLAPFFSPKKPGPAV